MTEPLNVGPALTWNDLADWYHELTGRQARVMEPSKVFEELEAMKDKFWVDPSDDTIHVIL